MEGNSDERKEPVVEVDSRPDQEQKRNEVVRNTTIHPNLQSALGPELFERYNEMSDVKDLPHPRIAQIIQDNPQVRFEAIRNSEGEIENWVIEAPVSEHLTLVTVLEAELKHRFSGVGFTPLAIAMVNQEGKVVNLLDYFPYSARTGKREIHITMDERLGNKTLLGQDVAIQQPPVTLRNIDAMFHEAGHLWAENIHSGTTKNSVERDAAAFVDVAARELKRRGFLQEEDVRRMIQGQQSSLAVYQAGREGSPSGGAFTREAVNLARFRDMEARKPPEERRTRRKVFEDLVSSLKQLSTEFIGRAQEIKERHRLWEEERDIFEPAKTYFALPPDIFRVIIDSRNGAVLQEYSPGENGEVIFTYYTFDPKGLTISTHKLTDEGRKREQQEFVSLGFDEAQSELGVDIPKWQEKAEKIRIFLQAYGENKLTKIRLDQWEVLKRLSVNVLVA